MHARTLTLIWAPVDGGADVTLLAGDGGGVAPLAWRGRHLFDPAQAAAETRALSRAVRRAVVRGKGQDALAASGRLLFDLLLPGPVKAALRGPAGLLTMVGGDWPWPLLHDGVAHLGLRWALSVELAAQQTEAIAANATESLWRVGPRASLTAPIQRTGDRENKLVSPGFGQAWQPQGHQGANPARQQSHRGGPRDPRLQRTPSRNSPAHRYAHGAAQPRRRQLEGARSARLGAGMELRRRCPADDGLVCRTPPPR